MCAPTRPFRKGDVGKPLAHLIVSGKLIEVLRETAHAQGATAITLTPLRHVLQHQAGQRRR